MKIQGSTGRWYDIYQAADGAMVCSCPAWKFQRKPGIARTCRHIKELGKRLLAHAAS